MVTEIEKPDEDEEEEDEDEEGATPLLASPTMAK